MPLHTPQTAEARFLADCKRLDSAVASAFAQVPAQRPAAPIATPQVSTAVARHPYFQEALADYPIQ